MIAWIKRLFAPRPSYTVTVSMGEQEWVSDEQWLRLSYPWKSGDYGGGFGKTEYGGRDAQGRALIRTTLYHADGTVKSIEVAPRA